MKKIKTVFCTTLALLWKTFQLSRANTYFTILSTLIRVTKKIATILMPAVFLNVIESAPKFSYILSVVIVYVLIVTIADMSEKSLTLQLTALGYGLSNKAALTVGKKGMKVDFKHWENSDSLDKSYRAMTSTWIFMGINDVVFENLFMAITSLIVISYIVIKVNPFIWGVVIFLVALGALLDRKRSRVVHSLDMEYEKKNKKVSYDKDILSNLKYGKEIRLFNASTFLCEKFKQSSQEALLLQRKKQLLTVKCGIISQTLAFLESVLIYWFAIMRYAKGLLPLGYFLTFFNAIREFSYSLNSLMQVWIDLCEIDDYNKDYQNYMDSGEELQTGRQILSVLHDFEIRFVNVYFRYPNSETYILEDVNLTINSKEKVALVGENGSGKTTLVKLLLRLYDVTEGAILVNGINIKEYDYDSYLHIFAPIFQDYQLHAYTIRENIAFLNQGDDEQIWALLKENKIDTEIQKCPEGLNTYTTKLLDEKGREFSGGERQKLAIVRAQYKKASVFVLDEPTSAIDPIAEKEFFRRINNIMKSQTVVYVSHRMASTKFADRIFVLKDKTIVEEGCHFDLIKKGGVYAEMFNLQASYYDASEG